MINAFTLVQTFALTVFRFSMLCLLFAFRASSCLTAEVLRWLAKYNRFPLWLEERCCCLSLTRISVIPFSSNKWLLTSIGWFHFLETTTLKRHSMTSTTSRRKNRTCPQIANSIFQFTILRFVAVVYVCVSFSSRLLGSEYFFSFLIERYIHAQA